MAIEADYVYCKSHYNINGANINPAYNAATGLPFPTTRSTACRSPSGAR